MATGEMVEEVVGGKEKKERKKKGKKSRVLVTAST